MMDKCFGVDPREVFAQYHAGVRYKNGLGVRGLYEQNKMNERYLIGDQWHGVNCGNDRPLVRHNVIKRIADYKMSWVGSAPIAVNYSADGVAYTDAMKKRVAVRRAGLADGEGMGFAGSATINDEEINVVMSALSDYYHVTSERVKFDDVREQALHNAYCSGTGIVYTYWDERIQTGLYADDKRRTAVCGDIAVEVLDVENVYFGDPNLDDVQAQPYIIIAQRRGVDELRREARRYGVPEEEISRIVADGDVGYMAGQRGGDELEDSSSGKTVVLTRLWKQWSDDGKSYRMMAVRVCEHAVVRPAWEMDIQLYPLAKFSWERRRGCIYGDSEISYLIPNQIAINRMMTASVWAVMMMGMPIMMVNSDLISDEISNDPGQIIRVAGDAEEVKSAAMYLEPPQFSPAFDEIISSLIGNTLSHAGASDAALGDLRPDNASAIIAVRDAATMPLQTIKSRYYSFCEDIARIWADFWVNLYGRRAIKVEDENGVWYFPFDGQRYRELLVSTRVDVGDSSAWGEAKTLETLDGLFGKGIIDVMQYLKCIPKGVVPDITGLVREIQAADKAAAVAAVVED